MSTWPPRFLQLVPRWADHSQDKPFARASVRTQSHTAARANSIITVRPPCHDGFMGKAAVVRAFEDIKAALAVLDAEVDGAGLEPFSVTDPLAGLADGCLDILAASRQVEAGIAGLKAKAA